MLLLNLLLSLPLVCATTVRGNALLFARIYVGGVACRSPGIDTELLSQLFIAGYMRTSFEMPPRDSAEFVRTFTGKPLTPGNVKECIHAFESGCQSASQRKPRSPSPTDEIRAPIVEADVHLKPVGVNRRVIRGKQVWVATWRNDGIRTTEVYSIDKLGDAEALRLALRARTEEMDFKARIHAAESRGINSLQLKAMRNFARKARREERRRLLALRL